MVKDHGDSVSVSSIDESSSDDGSDEMVTDERCSKIGWEPVLRQCFARYDIDNSGRIDSVTELEQLVYNACFKCHCSLSPASIDELVLPMHEEVVSGGWDFNRFNDWFHETIQPKPPGAPAPRLPRLGALAARQGLTLASLPTKELEIEHKQSYVRSSSDLQAFRNSAYARNSITVDVYEQANGEWSLTDPNMLTPSQVCCTVSEVLIFPGDRVRWHWKQPRVLYESSKDGELLATMGCGHQVVQSELHQWKVVQSRDEHWIAGVDGTTKIRLNRSNKGFCSTCNVEVEIDACVDGWASSENPLPVDSAEYRTPWMLCGSCLEARSVCDQCTAKHMCELLEPGVVKLEEYIAGGEFGPKPVLCFNEKQELAAKSAQTVLRMDHDFCTLGYTFTRRFVNAGNTYVASTDSSHGAVQCAEAPFGAPCRVKVIMPRFRIKAEISEAVTAIVLMSILPVIAAVTIKAHYSSDVGQSVVDAANLDSTPPLNTIVKQLVTEVTPYGAAAGMMLGQVFLVLIFGVFWLICGKCRVISLYCLLSAC